MKQWLDPAAVTVPSELRDAIDGHPVVIESLVRRGITTPAKAMSFMHWHHYRPTSAFELPDMDKAVTRVQQAINQREVICVWGDFDVDGQTATALLVSALRTLDAVVMAYIPQRLTEGHGMHKASLARQIDAGAQLILTCDTGVDEHEAVDYARSRGVDVVVTDHHKLPETLPDAFAVVNPRRLPQTHPLRDLPGVGVAYKLIEALAPDRDWSHLLDLVALGIVADVAVQRGDTRYLLQRGLEVLRQNKRLGLAAMAELTNTTPADINEETIAFQFAPRLNAIGRLGDANPSTELLTTNRLERARILASQLEGLNAERRRLSDEVWNGVQVMLEREQGLLKHTALVIGHPDWHTGVVGIVANRCVEAYNRPVLLLATPKDGPARGSARSIAGVDITDAIADNADLLMGYGGHTMAAGITIERDKIPDFRRGLSDSVRAQLNGQVPSATLQIDRYLKLSELNLTLVRDVVRLAPFGAGNPPLVFATTGLTITGQRQLGRDAKHLALTVEDDIGTSQRVIWWNAEEPPTGRFDLAYTIRENTFKGERELLIEWLAYRQAEVDKPEIVTVPQYHYVDHRLASNPSHVLAGLQAEADVQIWGEVALPDGGAVNRLDLQPAPVLAVWTAPPSYRVWRGVLAASGAEHVHLLGVDPAMDAPKPFLERLTGLVNYALRAKDGQATVDALAAATAQREITVRVGLDWLAARGQITVTPVDAGTVQITRGGTSDPTTADDTLERLKVLLAESAAYRAYWRRASTDLI